MAHSIETQYFTGSELGVFHDRDVITGILHESVHEMKFKYTLACELDNQIHKEKFKKLWVFVVEFSPLALLEFCKKRKFKVEMTAVVSELIRLKRF